MIVIRWALRLEEGPIYSGFIRKQRFLIAVSIALTCINLLGLTFETINVLGNSARITHPEYAIKILWIFWALAYVQYVVWFRDAKLWHLFIGTISSDAEASLGRKIVKEDVPIWAKNQLESGIRPQLPPDTNSKISYVPKFCRVHGDGNDRKRSADLEVVAYAWLPHQKGEVSNGPLRYEREIESSEWTKTFFKAAVIVLLTRRFTLEYFLPFVVGIFPVVVWLIRI